MYANLYHCAIDLQSSLPTICAFYVCLGHSAKLCTFYEQQQVENRVLLYSTHSSKVVEYDIFYSKYENISRVCFIFCHRFQIVHLRSSVEELRIFYK